MEIFVKTLKGKSIAFNVSPNDTVLSLKEKLKISENLDIHD